MTKAWGPCTWFVFHTLAEKIKEDSRIVELITEGSKFTLR